MLIYNIVKLKIVVISSENYHDYHFMLQVKLLAKYRKWSGKFVSRFDREKVRELYFQIFGGTPTGQI